MCVEIIDTVVGIKGIDAGWGRSVGIVSKGNYRVLCSETVPKFTAG